jgi:uncharacterized membrane protein
MSDYNRIAGQRLERTEALSDGVFSIAMTFLVFNLKVPAEGLVQSDVQLAESLKGALPNLLAFFLSFMTLGIFWTGHSTQFIYIEKSDRNLNWISIFFLMFASLLPFTTAVLSSHITNRLSIGLYWLNILAMGTLLLVHWNYAHNKQLLEMENADYIHGAIRRRIYTAQALYTLGALLCFISTYVSIFFIIAVQLNYALGIINHKRKDGEPL